MARYTKAGGGRRGGLLALTAPAPILYVLSILYCISCPVYTEVLYVDVCVLVHFPVGQLAESKGLVLTWGPFTVNLTPLKGRAFFSPFSYLILWSGTSPSVHHTVLHLRMAVNLSQKKLFIKMLNEVLRNLGYQLIPPQLSFLKYGFSSQRQVVVRQEKECQKESNLFVVADCCVELKPTSPGQFFFLFLPFSFKTNTNMFLQDGQE